MKERIEFTTEGTIKGRKEIAKINEYVNYFNFDCEFKRKIEQEPETFEELKELCEKLCEKIKVIEVYTEYISCHKFLFWKNGAISSETDDGEEIVYIADRTPQQMWQIIKNLIGE